MLTKCLRGKKRLATLLENPSFVCFLYAGSGTQDLAGLGLKDLPPSTSAFSSQVLAWAAGILSDSFHNLPQVSHSWKKAIGIEGRHP